MSPIIEKNFLEQKSDTFWMTRRRADHQDIRPLKIAILNLMPNKLETEEQLFRVLSNTPLQLDIELIRTETYQSKNTSPEILKRRYRYFSELRDEKFDAFIITGSPIEKMDFEEVAYWEELTHIFDYVREHVYSTLFLCWSAQAALYYYYGIRKHLVDQKIFQLERFRTLYDGPLSRGFDSSFVVPQSRYTLVKTADIINNRNLILYAGSQETGAQIVASQDHRFVFSAGHLEYDEDTLDKEYRRDMTKGMSTKPPKNYYWNDDPDDQVLGGWKATANLFFSNWINYCVYQQTPYEIEKIPKKIVAKFGGTSLSEAAQFSKVKQIINNGKQAVIVASAPGKRNEHDHKVTDQLIDYSNMKSEIAGLTRRIEQLKALGETALKDFEDRFHEIADRLDLDGSARQDIVQVCTELSSSEDRSFIVSRGEYLNAKLLAKYLDYQFIDAIDLIRFDASGNLDGETTAKQIRHALKQGGGVVVPGFYGQNPYGHIKLLDRGGSDITGSLIASALKSEVYQNWTDVNGVMDDDPAHNPAAESYAFLSYEQLLEITQSGAGVYHPDAIKPLVDSGVRLEIKNTNQPQAEGTKVGKYETEDD